jgi:hypothetical protein
MGDADGRRLEQSPALVAAGRLPRLEREDEALGQGHPGPGGGLEVIRNRVDRRAPDQDVPLHGVAGALVAAGPRVGLLPGERGGPSLHVDDPDLSPLAPLVAGQQALDCFLRRHPLLEQVEPLPAVLDHRPGLRRHRADARPHPGDRPADERHARRHRHAALAGLRIDGADREGGVAQAGGIGPGRGEPACRRSGRRSSGQEQRHNSGQGADHYRRSHGSPPQ